MSKSPQADISSNLTPRQTAGTTEDDIEYETYRRKAGFAQLEDGGLAFVVRDELASEFMCDEIGAMFIVASAPIEKRCWVMVIPPDRNGWWSLLVEGSEGARVNKFLDARCTWQVTAGPHTEGWDDDEDDPEGPANDT